MRSPCWSTRTCACAICRIDFSPKTISNGSSRLVLKASIRKIVGKLRGKSTESTSTSEKKARRRRPSGRSKPDRDVTGQTVFADRPLHFQSLSVTEVDLPTIQHPETIEGGAFKIRVAKRTGARRDASTLVH